MSEETPRRLQPSASYSFTMRLHLPQHGGAFARVAHAIADADAMLGAIDLVRVESDQVVRDVTVACVRLRPCRGGRARGARARGRAVDSVSDRTFLMHKGGKIEVNSQAAAQDPRRPLDGLHARASGASRWRSTRTRPKAWALTIKGNTVAVVSDGTAVLGLGDIGPAAAMPVMEGKAMLFKEFAGVDAFPLCLDTKDVDEIVAFVKAAAPDVRRHQPRGHRRAALLRDRAPAARGARHPGLPRRPARHGDRRARRAAQRAALVGKRPEDVTVVVVGAGAAGVACTDILLAQGVGDVIVCNRRGALLRRRGGLDAERAALAERTNRRGLRGTADEVLAGADVLLGLSGPGAVSAAGGAHDGRRRDRLRDGEPGARGAAGGGPRRRRDHGDRPLRLPQPDQQRARLPGRLQGRARGARAHDQRGDEARRRARDRAA